MNEKVVMSVEMASLEESFINFHFKELKEEMDTFEEDDNEDELKEESIDPSFMQLN